MTTPLNWKSYTIDNSATSDATISTNLTTTTTSSFCVTCIPISNTRSRILLTYDQSF